MVRKNLARGLAFFTFTLLTASTLTAQARRLPSRGDGAVIAEIRIAMRDLSTREEIGHVLPGQRLTLEVGDQVRLRLVGIPAQARRAPRYPGGRFDLVSRSSSVALSRVDPQQGAATVQALRTGRPAVIRYRLLEDLNVPRALVEGSITIDVVEPEPDPPPQRLGVTLYEHQDFRGRSESFYQDDRRLNDNAYLRHDMASSLRVDRGCEVTLFEHPDYGGRASAYTGRVTDLNGSRVGNDSVSSLQIRCEDESEGTRPDSSRGGVTLYEHHDFRGRSETFRNDDPQLRDNYIRHDTVSSIRVEPGCRVVLYEHPNYQGRATALSEDLTSLHDSRVGNDTVSSVEVTCDRR